MPTDIEWCRNEDGTKGQTWNPTRGCDKISPGCKHCYASVFAERWRGVPGHPYEQGFDLRLVPDKLSEPLRRRKPTTYFVNSMSDLFHEQVPFEFIDEVFAVMVVAQQHKYQVLTKRAGRMRAYMNRAGFVEGRVKRLMRERGLDVPQGKTLAWPPPHIWLGVSVEDRKHGLPRIDVLREVPAAVRFLSVEPLLEDLGQIDLTGIDWVIVGGESGHGARPMHPEWARRVRDQCVAASVAFFFKQWGEWVTAEQMAPEEFRMWDASAHRDSDNRDAPLRLGKGRAGRELDGRTWDEMPRGVL